MSKMNAPVGKGYKKISQVMKKPSRAAAIRKAVVPAKKGKLIESKASKAQKIAARLALKADPSLKSVKVTPRQKLAIEAQENASGKA